MKKNLFKKLIPYSFATRIGILILVAGLIPITVFGTFLLYSFTKILISSLETSIISLEKEQKHRMAKIMEKTAQKYVRDRTIDIARQLDIYLKAHPEKTLSDLRVDPRFRELAIQPVGKSGYTAIQTSDQPIRCVIHKNKEIEGVLLKKFSNKYKDFWQIIKSSSNGRYSYGFYKWFDDKNKKEITKFMYIVPLREKTSDGIRLSVAATISLDEFISPLKNLEHISERFKYSLLIRVKNVFFYYRIKGIILVGIIFLFIIVITAIIGRYFSKEIGAIRSAINEINKGNLDVSIKPFMSGEIEDLIKDFNAMVKVLKETTVKKEALQKTKKLLEELNLELRAYIEKLRKTEEDKNKLIEDLKTKTDELETFIYIVSHDLRSPLITIKGFLDFLEEDYKKNDKEKIQQDINYIKKACESMDMLLKDLLEFSRIGRKKEQPENVSLEEILAEVLFLLSGPIREKGINIEIKTPLPNVYGDRTRIREVFQNLIENSIKYMGEQKNPRIEIGTKRKRGKEVIYVKDNGIGIAPEYHKKIFNLFEQLDAEIDGTGAGLAIVKKILQLHNGNIWVESEEGKGSTFYVYLPQKRS